MITEQQISRNGKCRMPSAARDNQGDSCQQSAGLAVINFSLASLSAGFLSALDYISCLNLSSLINQTPPFTLQGAIPGQTPTWVASAKSIRHTGDAAPGTT